MINIIINLARRRISNINYNNIAGKSKSITLFLIEITGDDYN